LLDELNGVALRIETDRAELADSPVNANVHKPNLRARREEDEGEVNGSGGKGSYWQRDYSSGLPLMTLIFILRILART
jgi:hypothetical protein